VKKISKNLMIKAGAVLLCFGVVQLVSAESGGVHWSYKGAEGPKKWASLSDDFETCGSGREQSPIDITDKLPDGQSDIAFHYESTPLEILNNGHTIQVNYESGSYIKVAGVRYDLLQFHFHSPSEHTKNKKSALMEVHFVHKSADGQLAVIGVFMDAGSSNADLNDIWKHMPRGAGETEQVDGITVNADRILPTVRDYVSYPGSLTTPPCSEGVRWMVMKERITVASSAVNKFVSLVGKNARPVEPLYSRLGEFDQASFHEASDSSGTHMASSSHGGNDHSASSAHGSSHGSNDHRASSAHDSSHGSSEHSASSSHGSSLSSNDHGGSSSHSSSSNDHGGSSSHGSSRATHAFKEEHKPHWTYTGVNGPDNWGSLHKDFHMCSAGRNQSPIDIRQPTDTHLFDLDFQYSPVALQILNNGHTIQFNYGNVDNSDRNRVNIGGKSYLMPSATHYNSRLLISGEPYELLQVHFHSPSEHTLNGKSHVLEAHLVHRNKEGQLAVVGVFFEKGSNNGTIDKVWEHMPQGVTPVTTYGTMVNAEDLLPRRRDYFHYRGSLTTPPCSEGVRWFVMKNVMQVSDRQVRQFRDVVERNNRPVQPLNKRYLLSRK